MADQKAYADRVQETTTVTGTTSPLSLGGAVSGFQTFANAVAVGSRVNYTIQGATTEWEVGSGVFTNSGSPALTREVVFASSNAGALVSFSAGTKNVFVDLPAQNIADIGLTLMFAANCVPR